MRRLLCAAAALVGLATPAWAYIDASPTLASLTKAATNIVVLRVEKVSREKRVIIYRKVADLTAMPPGPDRDRAVAEADRDVAALLALTDPADDVALLVAPNAPGGASALKTTLQYLQASFCPMYSVRTFSVR